MNDSQKIIIGISQGDINGVGIEVILKTLSDHAITEICTPIIFSSQKTIAYYKKLLGLDDLNFHLLKDINQINHKKVNLYNCYEEEVTIEPGQQTELGGKYAFVSLNEATNALLQNKINVLVTAPINKKNIQRNDFNFIGHTEFLGNKFNGNPLMLLCSENGLRVALVTEHLPIKDVASKLNKELIQNKIKQLTQSLLVDFGIRKPKIAVLGLNPHAGDNGAIGTEDKIISDAIQSLDINALVYGPYPADGFFGNSLYTQFDAVLAMYHDQGLIPFKTIAFNSGVNYTAGLNVVRTSPDHGTAYDIAGKGIANEQSFKQAIYMAIDVFKARKMYSEISANPLPFSNIKKER
ncbi:MAG: 4-hydroxythreonine-4-phosphate dehydrogenase PdxA [Bacteroidia bacterium]